MQNSLDIATVERHPPFVVTLAQALKTAREARGLSQARLASLAKISEFTLRRAESGRTESMYSGNAARLIRALNDVAALTPEEASDFTSVTGLTEILWRKDGPFFERPPRVEPDELSRFVDALRAPTGAHARLLRAAAAAEPYVNLDRIADALERLVESLRAPQPLSAAPPHPPLEDQVEPRQGRAQTRRTLTVVQPPVQREGYVEQQFRHLEVDDESEAQPARRPASKPAPKRKGKSA